MQDKTNTPIATAARLLRESANELQQSHTTSRDRNDWTGEEDAKAAYDEHMEVAIALEAIPGQCLHQIQEPTPSHQPVSGQSRFTGQKWEPCAAEHVAMVLATPHEWQGYEVRYLYAAPAEGSVSNATFQAAPAAVAVPDAVRDAEKLLREEAARLERIYGTNKWYGFSAEKDLHIEHLRVAAALAATPAAELATFHATQLATLPAAAPVVLPEPDGFLESHPFGSIYHRGKPSQIQMICGACPPMYEAGTVRALLATATGLPAQAVPAKLITAINTVYGGNEWQGDALVTDLLEPACRAIANLSPQAQADARDADDAALIEWLSGQYLAADFHWGDPKTSVLVIEIPPTASVCGDFRTDVLAAIAIAAAKGK